MKRLFLIVGAAAFIGLLIGFGAWRLLDDGARRQGALTGTPSVEPGPTYLNISSLQLRPSGATSEVILRSAGELQSRSDGIDPASESVSVKLSTQAASNFYSKTITGFDRTATGWSISGTEKIRTGIQLLTIDRTSRGFALALEDTEAAIGARDYSHVTVDLSIGNDVGQTEALLAEKPARSGDWQFVTLDVPGQFATIGAAIEAAPDGATILVAAGTYRETLRIEKRLRIVGPREARAQLVSPSRDTGIVTYAKGGGGELTDLDFVGGAYGVGSDPKARGDALPSPVALHKVSIVDGHRGVYGAFSGLSAIDVSVANTAWNGFSLTHLGDFALLFDIEVHDSNGIGLYVNNHGAGDVSIGGHYHHNAYAGVQVSGNNGNVTFLLTVADHNGLFGVGLFGVNAGMGLSAMEDQRDAPPLYNPGGTCEGVGLLAVSGSVVSVAGTRFEDNCLGLSIADASVTVTQSIFSSTNVQQTEGIVNDPNLTFGAGNVCGYNIDLANESVVPCGQFVLGPPQVPTPQGGLE